jgi:hypothetical protein
MKYRHELKYLINYPDLALIRMRLGALLQKDEHARDRPNGMYTVRSLYFDDYYNNSYNQKYMGISDRQKYRIRLYNQSTDVIFLERKVKRDHYIGKEISALSKTEVENIMGGDYDFLLESPQELKRMFYHECHSKIMRSRVVVDYEREPYVMDAGQVRINFDLNVRAGLNGLDIFDDKMVMVEVLEPHQLIMEVKFTEFLPDIVHKLIPAKASELTAVSKFVLACDQTIYKRLSVF